LQRKTFKDGFMRFQGKVALVTGGNSGIGLATAKRFVAEGAKVVITGRNQETLDRAVAELGPAAAAVAGDVTDIAALEEAVATAVRAFGHLDMVFANAGVSGGTPLGETTPEAFRRIIDINLLGPFLTAQAALPHLPDGASIVLNGSVHAVAGIPGSSAYAASKAGVRAMARNLAAELGPRRIRVNVVVPGATRTPIWSNRAPTPEAFEKLEAGFVRNILLGRIAESDEIASAVLFLTSDESRFITAAEIVVDGGFTGAPAGIPASRD
jgi:NAD(P)-dependent dehydrogenase (short-subunit alcohol dehydrogenase family)